VQVMGNVLIIFANAKLDFMVEIAQYKCVPKIVMEMVSVLKVNVCVTQHGREIYVIKQLALLIATIKVHAEKI